MYVCVCVHCARVCAQGVHCMVCENSKNPTSVQVVQSQSACVCVCVCVCVCACACVCDEYGEQSIYVIMHMYVL